MLCLFCEYSDNEISEASKTSVMLDPKVIQNKEVLPVRVIHDTREKTKASNNLT
jgi:hypothetical protein